MYDISSRTSFASLEHWFEEVESNTVPGVVLYLVCLLLESIQLPASTRANSSVTVLLTISTQVGAKLDKAETSRAVPAEEGMALAEAHGARFCEASAKTRENVRRPFVEVVDQIVAAPALVSAADSARVSGGVILKADDSGSYCSC